MNFWTILLIAVGLAADAFAVSISCGISDTKNTFKNALKAATAFGAFQAGMTGAGWFAGFTFRAWIENIDHWVAFLLLGFIGAKMIKEALSSENECIALTSFKLLITLAIATSIDAFAAGISLTTLKVDIVLPVLLIGIITFVLSFAGVFLGRLIGCNSKIKSYIDVFGGLILIGIGTKVLIEHLM